MNKLLSCAFASVLSATVFATAVRTLPEPDADGYYAFGAPYTSSATNSYSWKSDANTPAYPVWAGMTFPDGAKLKLTGGVIIDSWPTGVTEVDCSDLTFMAITATRAIPAGVKIVIPSGAKLCVCKGTTTVAGDDSVTWAEETDNPIELANDLELDGTLYWNKNTLAFSGELSGSGSIPLDHMNYHLAFQSTVDFSGEVVSGQGGQDIVLSGSETSLGYVYLYGKANYPSYFVCNPDLGSPVEIDVFRAAGASYESGTRTRKTTFFCIANGNVANIGVLGGSGCHFITQTAANALQRDDIGEATVLIGNVDPRYDTSWPSGQKQMDCYFSKNMSYAITDICREGTSSTCSGKRVTIHYEAESGNNTNSLSIGSVPSGSRSSWMSVEVKGLAPASLPRTMTLPPNAELADGVKVSITEDDWSFDFDWTKDDPNLSRCVITGAKNLTMPATGTISVNVTGAPSAKGVYPLFSCNVGCAALTDPEAWPVTIAGTTADSVEQNGVLYAVIRSETGISLEAKPITGLLLIFR